MNDPGLHEEMLILRAKYTPLFDEASALDEINLAGRKPKDYDGEWARVYRLFLEEYKAIRRKYGIINEGRPS